MLPLLPISSQDLDKKSAYRLMISLLLPRPIAWVGSVSAAGVDNLAPFSYFMGVSASPPMLAISVARGRDQSLKDTARNLLETGVFTVSMVEEPDLERMHRTSATWEQSEFDAVGIPRAPGQQVAAPYVAGVRVAMECRVAHTLDLGATHLFVGEVVVFHIAPDLYRDGVVDIHDYRPVARLGGDGYTTLGTLLHLPPARVGG